MSIFVQLNLIFSKSLDNQKTTLKEVRTFSFFKRLKIQFRINISVKVMLCCVINTTQQMKFSITDFLSKCDQIPSFLRIWSHLLKKSLMENIIFLCSAISKMIQCNALNTVKSRLYVRTYINSNQLFRELLTGRLLNGMIYF